jgi:hypothetical protein
MWSIEPNFIHTVFDENTGGQILLRPAERDPQPHWNEPMLGDDSTRSKATVAETKLARKLRESD